MTIEHRSIIHTGITAPEASSMSVDQEETQQQYAEEFLAVLGSVNERHGGSARHLSTAERSVLAFFRLHLRK